MGVRHSFHLADRDGGSGIGGSDRAEDCGQDLLRIVLDLLRAVLRLIGQPIEIAVDFVPGAPYDRSASALVERPSADNSLDVLAHVFEVVWCRRELAIVTIGWARAAIRPAGGIAEVPVDAVATRVQVRKQAFNESPIVCAILRLDLMPAKGNADPSDA